MKLQFDSIKDTIDFIKLALYMNDNKAFSKFLKWKRNGELVVEGEVCTLDLSETTPFDHAFSVNLQSKHEKWVKNNKTSTLK